MDADHLSVDQDPPVRIDFNLREMTLRLRGFRADGQPDVAVDARPLIEPAFLEGRICPDCDHVVATVIQVFRDVIGGRSIAALLPAQPEAVDPDVRVAEDAVETNGNGLSQRLGRHREMLAVPAHAGFRPLPTHGLVAMAVGSLRRERQVHHPVVRQLHRLPGTVVELHGIGTLIMDGRRFCEIVEVFRAASEIFRRRRSVAECELPAVVKQHLLRCCGQQCKQEDQRQKTFLH